VQKIIETTTGKCLFAANNTAAVNELFVWDDEGCPAQIRPYDFMNTATLLTRSSQVDRQVCVSEDGPARVAVDVSCAMEWGTFRQRIILQAGMPWVDFVTHVDWYPAPEGGRRVRVAFPWAAGDPKVRRDIPFGVIDWEQTDTVIPTNSWLGLADEKESVGAALIHDGTGSQQVRGNLMWHSLFRSVRVPGDIKDDKPDPPCGWDVSGDNALEEGASIYRQRLVVHTGTWQQAAVPQRALEFTMPMSAVSTDRHSGELAGEKSDLAVEGEGLVVCAWKQADYTDGMIVRVYNTGGDAVSGALTVGFDVACVEETDFREQHTGDLTVKNGRIDLQFGPYEIKTVRMVAK
jgi:alpha-mannosidase